MCPVLKRSRNPYLGLPKPTHLKFTLSILTTLLSHPEDGSGGDQGSGWARWVYFLGATLALALTSLISTESEQMRSN